MDRQQSLSEIVSKEVSNKLVAHKEKEREHVEALLASQKHLTSNVRTLINSLDQVAMLSAPKFNSNQPDVLRSAVSRARLLQKQLDAVRARMQRIQQHIGNWTAPTPIAAATGAATSSTALLTLKIA
ncbi:hypothetical protein OEZ86_010181 [Tetradesmus obliquus]|nr:hypothetical protein OEZ86_010181 [Tetradesmus obliquus]